MSHAEKCPICNGQGTIDKEYQPKNCHGCNGKGWVEVGDANISVLYPVADVTSTPPYLGIIH